MKTYTEEKRIRPDILTASVYLAIALMMVFALSCHRIYGDKGAFFSAGPLSIYLLFYCGLVLAAQKAVYIMVRLRARRSQFMNADANMHRSIRIFGIIGILSGIILTLLSYKMAQTLLGAERGFFQIIFAAVAIIFLGGQGVLRGYLQGIGYTRPIVMSDLLIATVSCISGVIAVEILYKYGLKVNNIFHIDEFSAVYGSAGLMAGILLGSIVGCVQIIVSYNLRKNEIADFSKRGAPRYLDNKNDVLTSIRPILLLYCTPPLMIFVDQCVFVIFTRKLHEDVDYASDFGAFAGRTVCSIILISILSCIPFIKKWNGVMARIERDELEGARQRFKVLMRYSNMLLFPVSVFVFALPETVMMTLSGSAGKTASSLMMLGGLSVLLCGFAILFSWLLNHMGKSIIIVINVAIGWGVHVAMLLVLFILLNLGIIGIMLSCMIAFLVFDLLSFFMISKMLKYRQDHIKCVLLPAVSSIIAGLIVFLLNKALVDIIGEVLSLLICIVVFYACYLLSMIVSRGVLLHELRRLPLGFLFEGIGSLLQHDRYYEG